MSSLCETPTSYVYFRSACCCEVMCVLLLEEKEDQDESQLPQVNHLATALTVAVLVNIE